MYVDLSPEQTALRDQLRGYFADLVTDELRAELRASSGGEGGGPEYRRILKRLADDGWLGIGWPKEYGGQGRSAIEQYIFAEEVQRVGFPLPFLTLGTVGPTHHALRRRRSRSSASCRRSCAASSTSRSATPSPRPAPTSPR